MDFQNVQYPIDRVIAWIRSGRLALPEFQRDFVWSPAKVVELLDSVSKQWPIGSLLVLRGPQPFAIRAIESAPKIYKDDLDYYILDGQQRITALYHAIEDVSDYCYAIRFDEVGEDDAEVPIFWERRSIFERKYPSLESRANAKIALIADVWGSEKFFSWLELAASTAETREAFVRVRERKLAGLQQRVYKLIAIELDQEIELGALARIFETLNRTGVKLGAFDLLVATLFPHNFDLRSKWVDAVAINDDLAAVEPEPVELIKLIALQVRFEKGKSFSRGVRQGDLLNLDQNLIRSGWDASVEKYARALNWCASEGGAFCRRALPSWAQVLGVAAWMDRIGDNGVSFWYWQTGFSQYFDRAVNTQVVAEYEKIRSGKVSVSRKQLQEDFASALKLPARSNGIALRSLVSLLAKLGSVDPLSGRRLSELEDFEVLAMRDGSDFAKLGKGDLIEQVVVVSKESYRALQKKPQVANWVARYESGFLSQGLMSRDRTASLSARLLDLCPETAK